MNSSQARVVSLGALVVLILTLPLQGQVETVELRHKLTPGEILTYSYSASTTSQFSVIINTESVRESDTRQLNGKQIINVKAVSANGTMTLEIPLSASSSRD
jgi:hypothetical protein